MKISQRVKAGSRCRGKKYFAKLEDIESTMVAKMNAKTLGVDHVGNDSTLGERERERGKKAGWPGELSEERGMNEGPGSKQMSRGLG